MTKNIFDRIDEICASLKDAEYRKIIVKEMQKKNKIKRDLDDYRIITFLIQKEFPDSNISYSTIWRLLKIKETSTDVYNQVKRGTVKIRPAYNSLFATNLNSQAQGDSKIIPPDLDKFLSDLCHMDDNLKLTYKSFGCAPDEKTIKRIDTKLYELRKTFNKVYSYYNLDDDESV